MNRFIAFFNEKYQGAPRMVARKAFILSCVVFCVGAFAVLLAVVMAATGAVIVAALVSVLVVFSAFVLLLIRRGSYSVATTVFLLGLWSIMFLTIKFDQYVSIYECYVYGTLGLFLLIVGGLVGNDPRQAVLLTFLNLAEIAVVYLVDVLPAQGGKPALIDAQSLTTSGIMVVLGGICAGFLVRMQSRLMEESERAEEEARARFEATRSAVVRAEGLILESGRGIASGVERTAAAVTRMDTLTSDTASGVEVLGGTLHAALDVNEKSAAAQARVRTALEAYSKEVSNESSAVEQMARALDSISVSSKEKKESLSRLRTIARDVDARLTAIASAVSRMSASTMRVRDMNVLISDVAERTNMLGMNSSIEAAHLGSAGRGFEVIAGQIRALSREAAEGSKSIAGTLGEASRAIADVEKATADSAAFFKSVVKEIDGISMMLEELLAGMQEASAGSTDLLQSVGRVSSLTAATRAVVDEAEKGMEGSRRSMKTVGESSRSIAEAMKSIRAAFALILEEVRNVRLLGDRNIEHVEALRGDLERAGIIG